MGGKHSFIFYYDWKEYLKALPDDAARGRLLMSLIEYASEGTLYSAEEPVERLLFDICKRSIDRDKEKYLLRCQMNAENAKKRWRELNEGTTCVLHLSVLSTEEEGAAK